jgi:CRISPR-associated protein (TIGR02584 family)
LSEAKKSIFIAVIGKSPAVLTGFLYYFYSGLYGKRRDFDKIIVLTTSVGGANLVKKILDSNVIERLEHDLSLATNTIPFSNDDILIFKDSHGEPLEDLLTSEDNTLAAKFIADTVKHYTDMKDTQLSVTVAGGRKTQAVMIANAFQLYGRAEDELLHLVVPENIMQQEEWFYPSNSNEPIYVSSVPILRVGRYLAKNLDLEPELLIKQIQESLVEMGPISELKIVKNHFTVDGVAFSLGPRQAAIYRYLLRRRLVSSCSDNCEGCKECCSNYDDFIGAFKKFILPELSIIATVGSGRYDNIEDRWSYFENHVDPIDRDKRKKDYISEILSTLRTELRKSDLSPQRCELLIPRRLTLSGHGKIPSYGVIVNPTNLHFDV